ncbi:hypothetical protein BDBG_17720 [Blastomyces gilchristii SLH14081]|uniref:Uncharacterized protein n=2 Tax=Blastomyces TaxID=229219 RepID=A0A179UYI4_BLAGS|nr:uncharacterized protein BDBG_17720 [Blastomyces gilchristii SLH14081]KMW67615.1 hypothetical protein BDDG_12216 [Blastomyces dermatitidis ATCC 18188]OAT12900.1 hypothetical protein BDBG_17720 [Blastomyces gilchristii SLH14081]
MAESRPHLFQVSLAMNLQLTTRLTETDAQVQLSIYESKRTRSTCNSSYDGKSIVSPACLCAGGR